MEKIICNCLPLGPLSWGRWAFATRSHHSTRACISALQVLGHHLGKATQPLGLDKQPCEELRSQPILVAWVLPVQVVPWGVTPPTRPGLTRSFRSWSIWHMAIANDMKVPLHDSGQRLRIFMARLEMGNAGTWHRARWRRRVQGAGRAAPGAWVPHPTPGGSQPALE